MKHAALLDATTLMFRAYFALPKLTSNSGLPTQCLVGIHRMIEAFDQKFDFTHIAACFDRPEPTFRHEAFPDYKAQREKAEDDFVLQIDPVKKLFTLYGIPVVEKAGLEADDLIATLAKKLSLQMPTLVFTTDQDLFSLLKFPQVEIAYLKRGLSEVKLVSAASFRDRYGISPEQWQDVKILKGDPSDNIPGVPGIGEKTALSLIQKYGDLPTLLRSLDKLSPRLRKSLTKHQAHLPLWEKIIALKEDLPLPLSQEDIQRKSPNHPKISTFLSEYSIQSKKSSSAQPSLL